MLRGFRLGSLDRDFIAQPFLVSWLILSESVHRRRISRDCHPGESDNLLILSPINLFAARTHAMDIESLQTLLDRCVATARKERCSRLMENPRRLLLSKALEVGLRLKGRGHAVEGETFWGDKMRLVFPEVVSLAIYRYGFFDEATTRFFLHHVKPGMTVFDVGAHFGYFTLLASRLVGQAGAVHSFEPTPDSYAVLERNARGRANVRLNHFAVDATPGTLEFFDYGPRFSAFNSLGAPRLSEKDAARLRPRKLRVSSVSLDEYTVGLYRPGLVKIDAEGTEFRILLGMERLIDSCRPAVALEVGDFDVTEVPPSRDVIRLLLDHGYEAFEYREGKILPHDLRTDYLGGNLLLLPK